MTAGLYGDPEESLALNLRRAFRDFEVWRKARKLQCTQGVWTPGLVACSCLEPAGAFFSNLEIKQTNQFVPHDMLP